MASLKLSARMVAGWLVCWSAIFILSAQIVAAQPLRMIQEFDFKPQNPDPAAGNLIQEYNRLKAVQDWAGALKLARDLAGRAAQMPDTLKADTRTINLEALGNFARNSQTDLAVSDREALGDYKDAVRLAGQDGTRVAQANVVMGLYYSKTGRGGFGASYLREATAYYTAKGDTFHIITGYQDFAALFGDRGELEVSNYFRTKAVATAETYFHIGVSPPGGQPWITYSDILHSSAAEAADRHDLAQLEKTWSLLRQISNVYFTYKFAENFAMAPFFAMAGNEQRARSILADGQRMLSQATGLATDTKRRWQITAVCGEAMLDWAAKRFDRAASLYRSCITDTTQVGEAVTLSSYVDYGNALEKSGQADQALVAYEGSIHMAERSRSSYSVADRAAVFNNPVFREPFWGRIRIFAEQAARARTADTFFNALSAAERIRARQFGELLLGDSDNTVPPARLQNYAAQLGDDTAAISYTLMNDRIVVLAFTRTGRSVAIVPIDGARFAADVGQLHDRLADPKSAVPGIERDLLALSRTVVAPIASLLSGKQKILVLQDGALDTIPFGLLTLRQDGYTPLLDQSAVRTLPSFRIELQQRQRAEPAARRGIFAVGDPAFTQGGPSTLLSRGEIVAISRGSRYLQDFPRLPGTRQEVDAILQLFKGEKTSVLLGGRATESALKTSDLRPYSYIHLATHGVLGGDLPGLNEPALVFAAERGQDGFFTATEASALHLNAEVTVLSACNTGSGRLLSGEGVLGMSRAFLLAGSRAVVVSLWSVGDESTAAMMQRFYQNKLTGMATPDALRAAMLDIRKSYPQPAYWGPFIVIGG